MLQQHWDQTNKGQSRGVISGSQRTLQVSQSQNQFLPQIKYFKRQSWNSRFHVSSTNNLAKAHPFFRVCIFPINLIQQYFDKSERVNDARLIKPEHPEGSLKTIFNATEPSIVQGSTFMGRSQSQHHFGMTQTGQGGWNPYFSKMLSKNNDRVHQNFREFFDRPIPYDQKGYSGYLYFSLSNFIDDWEEDPCKCTKDCRPKASRTSARPPKTSINPIKPSVSSKLTNQWPSCRTMR